MNTAGRIEALCRTLEAPMLISSELLECIKPMPAGIRARPLGDHAIKGRSQLLTILRLEQSDT